MLTGDDLLAKVKELSHVECNKPMKVEIPDGHKQVYAVIRGYTDNYTYAGESFNSLELFFSKEDAELRVIELELEILESGNGNYRYICMEKVAIK